jgi:hypothetical protein
MDIKLREAGHVADLFFLPGLPAKTTGQQWCIKSALQHDNNEQLIRRDTTL